ncbi:MAG: hypothetical protein RBS51_07420 [Anaerovoracaceae bacterium]|nr:hypothetical protein [Anaerovoracaceae bacterium]
MIEWKIRVSIFRNTLILKQLGIALGIPFGVLIIILLFLEGDPRYKMYGIGLILALFASTWVFVMIFYKGKYEVQFTLDNEGILCETQADQAKKNRIINFLALVLGLISKKPGVAGAGILGQSRQKVYLRWNKVKLVKYKPRQHTILLRGGPLESLGLFCTPENYSEVTIMVADKTRHLN